MESFDDNYTISGPTPALHARGPVVALRNQRTGVELELPSDGRRTLIGSSTRCDLVIEDRCVSKVHCALERHDEVLWVRDKRSKNGTYVNGSPIEAAELRPGAVLVVGKTPLIALAGEGRGVLTAYERLRGADPAFRDAVATAIRAAASDCNVLVVGETGTGKELIARAIHDASARSQGPFVAVNCGAFPRELIASELFGHARGAFTGATTERAGLFVTADGGTVFLDELGELPLEQQPHLLRVLETRRVWPVGGNGERAIDVRVVAATNRLQAPGLPPPTLRLDLYHRVATVVVQLPPLRERIGDVELLVRAFLAELAPRYGERAVSHVTLRRLGEYAWPGNVRELRQAVERALTLCDGDLSADRMLPPGARASENVAGRLAPSPPYLVAPLPPELSTIDAMARDVMLDALDREGSLRRAAIRLGIPKSTFCDRARRLGIKMR